MSKALSASTRPTRPTITAFRRSTRGAIAVNQDGQRFVNESISYKLLGDAVMAQPWHTGYQIMDQGMFDTGDDRVRILDFGRRLEEGSVLRRQTVWRNWRRQIEIEPAVLVATVHALQRLCRRGPRPRVRADQAWSTDTGELRRIETGPFYAYPSTAVVFGTYCGLQDRQPRPRACAPMAPPFPGLFAAGEGDGRLPRRGLYDRVRARQGRGDWAGLPGARQAAAAA
jgi:fumarate reductase flavoprotein subunit